MGTNWILIPFELLELAMTTGKSIQRASYELRQRILGDIAYREVSPLYVQDNRALPYESLVIGQSAESVTTVESWMLLYFAALSGDWNPAHMQAGGVPPFKEAIAHGLITGSFISALIASKLPGPGSIYLQQSFFFKRPVAIGDTITSSVVITALEKAKRDVWLDVVAHNQKGTLVLDGKALIRKPK